jgi:hypothetical protein
MSESLFVRQEKGLSAEQPALMEEIERGLENVGVARAELADTIALFDKQFPHDDILVDDGNKLSHSSRLYRCTLLGKMYELGTLEDELLASRKALQTAAN